MKLEDIKVGQWYKTGGAETIYVVGILPDTLDCEYKIVGFSKMLNTVDQWQSYQIESLVQDMPQRPPIPPKALIEGCNSYDQMLDCLTYIYAELDKLKERNNG